MRLTKRHFLAFSIITAGLVIIMIQGCKKEDNVEPPTISTLPVTGITPVSARSGGNITDDGGAPVKERGLVWSTNANPTVDTYEGRIMNGSGTGQFQSDLSNLSPATKYFVRAWATNNLETSYGLQIEFTTSEGLPSVTTLAVTEITSVSARSGGSVTGDGGFPVTSRGVVWGTITDPTVDNHEGITTDGEGTGEFSSNITELSPGIRYYVRAYATNIQGTVYGTRQEFSTSSELPAVSTKDVTEITTVSAISGGNVSGDGGSPVTSRGTVWSTSANPTVDNFGGKTSDGEGSGEFSSNLTDLSPGVKYYLRAYAINGNGTSYGSQVEFSTLGELPAVTTAEITGITSSSAKSGGTVTYDGGSTVTSRGIVWSTSIDPAVDNNQGKTVDGNGQGVFTSNLTGLSPGTKYYVRAYAVNSIGTAYGSQAEFNTATEPAVVTTAAVTEITSTSAISGGNVTDDGGSHVTSRGIVWSTITNPTVDNYEGRTIDGEGKGGFISTLSGLSPGVKYYLRAYAVNGTGTVYGSQVEFTTSFGLATVTTEEVTGITSSDAISGGNVTSDGGSAVTAKGIVWSRNGNPTIDSNEGRKTDGTGTGGFTSTLSGLMPETTYYVRAYAINSVGTAYGNMQVFETLPVEDTRPGPLFVFGFDDGNDSDYHYAYPELKSRGFRGTSFVNTIIIGTENSLTWEMIHEMVADGWEMGCHTHSHLDLTEAGSEEIMAEFETVNSLYQSQGLPKPRHHTYPYGSQNPTIRYIVSLYRLTGRTSTSPTNNFDSEDFDYMQYKWVHADMSNESILNDVKEKVDLAFEERTVLVSFLIHRIVPSFPGSYMSSLANFQELIDYVVAKGGNIVTMNEAYNIISNYRKSVNLE